MVLIRNGTSLSLNPSRLGGLGRFPVNRTGWTIPGALRGFYSGEGTVVGGVSIAKTAARPNGYEPPYSSTLAPKGGGLSAYTSIEHGHSLVASLSMGANIEATMESDGSITSAQLSLVVALACNLLSDCALTPAMQAQANLATTLVSSGDLTAAIAVLGNLVSTMTSAGGLDGSTLRGVSNMEATLTTSGTIVSGTIASIAEGVWAHLLSGVSAGDRTVRSSPTHEAAVVADAGNTSSSFKTDLSQTSNDHWKDALVAFSSGALFGQIKKVLSYNGTTKVLVVGPSPGFTSTPAASDRLVLVNR